MSRYPIPQQTLVAGDLDAELATQVDRWGEAEFGRRLWEKDPTLWFPEPPPPELTDRLGWLDLPGTPPAPELDDLAGQASAAGIEQVVLLGMGGSSLAPEVFQATMGSTPGHPRLLVLDSTHPAAVSAVRASIDPARTWFVLSSKSGTTLETLSFFHFFWAETSAVVAEAGRHFIAITDPGTPLQRLAGERRFRGMVNAPPDVGGRYSALTPFGLLPAALVGADVDGLLASAEAMAAACGPEVPVAENPALVLGALMGAAAVAGRDKLTYLVSPSLAAFPGWLEQLVAESTGKDGEGIVPVAGEPLAPPEEYGGDRLFIELALNGDGDAEAAALSRLERAGHPVVRIRLRNPEDLGAEMTRAEIAVAAAGAALGIHPFDQPDVQLAKDLAAKAMTGELQQGRLPVAAPDDAPALQQWESSIKPGDYLAIQAFLAPGDATARYIDQLRSLVRARHRIATTAGWGPRFLHSTGQLHKGGPNTAVCLQLVDHPAAHLDVPGQGFGFGQLIEAQARGDLQALLDRGRRVLRVDLGPDAGSGIETLLRTLDG